MAEQQSERRPSVIFGTNHGLLGVTALAILILCPAAYAQSQSDIDRRMYMQRFLQEVQRKMPEIVLPPPTAAELSAPRAPAAQAIDMTEARRIIGLGASGAGAASRIPGGKLAIIDSGFSGAKQWLDAHPDEKRLTQYFRINPTNSTDFVGDAEFSDPGMSEHGYWVYRVARTVLPDVPILLFRVSNLTEAGTAVIKGSATHGAILFNISLGFPGIFEVVSSEEDIFAKTLRVYLPQYEAFAFISAGNSRAAVHSWLSADRNNNGYVDFRQATETRKDADSARMRLRKGSNRIDFAWDVRNHPDANYQLELMIAGDRILTKATADPKSARKGSIRLNFTSSEDGFPAYVRIKRLAGPAGGVFMRLIAEPIGVPGDYNGLQTALTYMFRENPFAIYVGSFGKAAGRGYTPSSFSDIATGPDGKLIPHLLGPGQLRLDGKALNGTSFSSPFLTALYATRVGYNIKNLIERTSNHDRLAKGVNRFESSRWGIPDASKTAADLKTITGPTKVENVAHRIEGDNLVVKFSITRCCMESLTWYVFADIYDSQTNKPVISGSAKKSVAGFATLRSEKADYVRHPVEIKIPLKELEQMKGKSLDIKFRLLVRSWRTSPQETISLNEAPAYRIAM